MNVRFISASNVKAGIGSVTMDLPPEWQVGDVLLIMSYSPSRASSVPTMGPLAWNYYPSWMYVRRATALEVPPVYTFGADPNTPIAGFVSAWRNVDPAANLALLKYSAEQGAVHSTAGQQFFGPSGFPTTTVDGCEVVFCFQSESTNSHLVSISHSQGWTLDKKHESRAQITGTPSGWPNGLYTMDLGMWSARQATAGSTSQVRWYVTNDGPHPYYGDQEVSFFSAIAFPQDPATFNVRASAVVNGVATLSGERNEGLPITVTRG